MTFRPISIMPAHPLALGFIVMIIAALPLSARVLEVGSSRVLTLPSQAAAAARDGDTVLIDAGDYPDACRWTANGLLIRGVGGLAHVRDRTTGGKAIWVIGGNNCITSGDGSTSREIDLPNGGLAVVAGNVIAHTNSAQNSNLLGYGMEGLSNPVRSLFVAHNTFVTSRGAGTFVQMPAGGCDTLVVKNNIFAGRAEAITGGAVVRDTAANLVTRDPSAPRFVDPERLDFHLLPDSPAIDGGVGAGAAWGMPLLPATEYVHPAQFRDRALSGPPDIGALEYPSSVSVFPPSAAAAFEVDGPWPNPARGIARFRIAETTYGALLLDIIDRMGGRVRSTTMEGLAGHTRELTLSLEGLTPGWYLCRITHGGTAAYRPLLVY